MKWVDFATWNNVYLDTNTKFKYRPICLFTIVTETDEQDVKTNSG